MSSVALEHVTKRYGNVAAVNDLTLDVRDREFMVLVGPSGCGKTTVLRMIAGMEDPKEGWIKIGGRIVNDVEPRHRDVAMVFQNYALYPHMSVYENMAFGLKLRRMSRQEIEQRVGDAAALLGIDAYLRRKPRELSGGQRQRVALGRAIVGEPQVFLMDEPLSNLDARLRVQTRAELIKLHRRLGITTIYVTHDQVEAMTMGDRIAVMRDGVLQQCDTPMELYARPANLFVAAFIGTPSMNFVRGVLRKSAHGDHLVESGAFMLDAPALGMSKLDELVGNNVILGIRPADIYDKNLSNGLESTEHNTLLADVDLVEPMGDVSAVYLSVGGSELVAMIDGVTAARTGEQLRIVVDVSRGHLFDPETERSVMSQESVL